MTQQDQSAKILQILRRHLTKSVEGRRIVAAFFRDPDKAGQTLAAHLHKQLQVDKELANRLASALNGDDPNFTTIVTGGDVEKIVNIARVGVLNLTINRYLYSVFSSPGQVITAIMGMVLVTAVIASGIWFTQQPAVMEGKFNIAVAEFKQIGNSRYDTEIAEAAAQRLFSFLDGQYVQSSFKKVQVSHDKIGIIADATEAKTLADRINADLVIYGEVTILGDEATMTPRFYVAESSQPNVREVGGQHQLAAPIRFSVINLLDPENPELTAGQVRAETLIEFTKALVYLASDDMQLATDAINQSIKYGEAQRNLEGKEVLYLFASEISRLQDEYDLAHGYLDTAQKINEDYGRAYIARANIYYDQGNLYLARSFYQKALAVEDPPFGAYLVEKASLGLGNSCNVQLQFVLRGGGGEETAVTDLANCALLNYQRVIDTFNQQQQPEQIVADMTAHAYYGSGIIYQETGDLTSAKTVFAQAIQLTSDNTLKIKAENRLKEVTENE